MGTYRISDLQKIKLVQIAAILGFLGASAYAPLTWLNDKDFPTLPLIEGIYTPLGPFDTIIAWSFMGLMLLFIMFPKRILGLSIVVFYVYLCFVDQNRLQPYFYQSILTLLFVNIHPKKTAPKTIIQAVSLLFFATYFWSGVHKINDIFYIQWLHALEKHFSFVPVIFLKTFTYMVPWLELLMGVFLFFKSTRRIAVLSIIAMHSTIIVMLMYLGYGFNVIPWNIQNIISVWVLFWTVDGANFQNYRISLNKFIVVLFTILLPFSNLFGGYDHLLSFSFFTSKLNYYYIQINDKELEDQLPQHIQNYLRPYNDKKILYANEWAGDVNKVLFYPQDRCIYYLDNYIRSFSNTPDKEDLTTLVIYNK